MRESVLLLVRAVIQVYIRPAMIPNSTYANKILGNISGNVMDCSVDVGVACAVMGDAESDIAMKGVSAAVGSAIVLEGYERRAEDRGSVRVVEDMRIDNIDSSEHREGLIKHLVMSLVFLQARCPGEADIVPDAAMRYCTVNIYARV